MVKVIFQLHLKKLQIEFGWNEIELGGFKIGFGTLGTTMKKALFLLIKFTPMRISRILWLLCILGSSLSLNAQNKEVDSLLQKLESVNEQGKAAVYNRLAKIDSKNNPQKRIDYAKQALKFARDLEQAEEEFYALIHIGIGYSIL